MSYAMSPFSKKAPFSEARRTMAGVRERPSISREKLSAMTTWQKIAELERRSKIQGLANYYSYLLVFAAFRVHEFTELVENSLVENQWEVFLHTPWSDAIKYVLEHHEYGGHGMPWVGQSSAYNL